MGHVVAMIEYFSLDQLSEAVSKGDVDIVEQLLKEVGCLIILIDILVPNSTTLSTVQYT